MKMKIIFLVIIWDISFHYHYQWSTPPKRSTSFVWSIVTCPSGAMNIYIFNSLRSHSSLSDVLCGDAKSSLSSVFNHYHHNECKAWMFILGLPTGSKALKWSNCNLRNKEKLKPKQFFLLFIYTLYYIYNINLKSSIVN